MHHTVWCDTVQSYHFTDGFDTIFTICAVYAIWWTILFIINFD